jgi:hypothetical protein
MMKYYRTPRTIAQLGLALALLTGCATAELGTAPFVCGDGDPQCPNGYKCATVSERRLCVKENIPISSDASLDAKAIKTDHPAFKDAPGDHAPDRTFPDGKAGIDKSIGDKTLAKLDNAKPKPDASQPKPDSAKPKPDSSKPKPDASQPKPDTGSACGSITYVGCCVGDVVKWCASGKLVSTDCSTEPVNIHCGWNTYGYYCTTLGGSDPSGTHPKNCP